MDLDLDPTTVRQVLPTFLSSFATTPELTQALAEQVTAHVATWSDAEVEQAVECIRQVGSDTRVWPADPRLRPLARDYCAQIFTETSVEGLDHLRGALEAGPVLLLGNHLAYIDSLAIDNALLRAGEEALADRVVSVAGPKVYTDLFRRLAAACLHTVPAPQSTQLAHTARLSNKELARLALASLTAARGALREGKAILLFGEGSRTRTGRLQPFVRGVHRYLGLVPDLAVVPFALTGADRVMPVGIERMTPHPIHVRFGAPVRVADEEGTRQALATTWSRVAGLLPASHAPDDDTPAVA